TSTKNVFLKGIGELDLPIAHAEGRIVVRKDDVIQNWRSKDQIAVEYSEWTSSDPGQATHPANERYAGNPNGSTHNIAGLSDPTGRVFGLMPHPERFLFGTQHPHWTRLGLTGDGLGRQIFQNAIDYFE
ncbi:MAG: phosphoribosylformylglycinamidine synthase subunit PurQ, partial [Planctomycetes bacterium]|nr:phosphoribosylformylglycinamidine synthase subunit PurQ [Planctomycetota bacterium]